MELGELDEAQLRALCTRYRVAIFDRRDGMLAGIKSDRNSYPYKSIAAERRRFLGRIGCGTAVG
jgi:hypothetical protein